MKTQKTNINRLFITTTPLEMWIFKTRGAKSGEQWTWWTVSSYFFPNLCSFLALKAFYADFRRFVRFFVLFFSEAESTFVLIHTLFCTSIRNRALFKISSTICIERQICNTCDYSEVKRQRKYLFWSEEKRWKLLFFQSQNENLIPFSNA